MLGLKSVYASDFFVRNYSLTVHQMKRIIVVFLIIGLACGVLSAVQGEDQKIQQVTDNLLDLMNQQYYNHGNNRLRMAHVKQHGCVRATLNVVPNLNPTLAQGNIRLKYGNNSHHRLGILSLGY